MSKAEVESTVLPDTSYPGPIRAWYVVTVMVLTYAVAYVDRTMLTLLVKPIRASLHISDVQISLLHGMAFALFYTLLGIPMARIADRHHRRNLIGVGLFFWSVMTAVCGFARNFPGMFMARIGVGLGESTLSPAAYSLLSDYFPPRKLAGVLSVYTAGTNMGAGLAFIGGGALIAAVAPADFPIAGHMEPWQIIFVLTGFLGLPVMLLMATVREPSRHGVSRSLSSAPPLKEMFSYVGGHRAAYGFTIAGYSLLALLTNGLRSWIPTMFIRNFGWSAADIGYWFGLMLLIFGTAGTFAGGVLSTWMRRRGDESANLVIGVVALAIMLPFGITAPLLHSAGWALAFFTVTLFAGAFPFGAAAAAIQEITPNQLRGQISALFLFGLNIAGIGFGSTAIALITDTVFHDDLALKYSLSIIMALIAPIGMVLLLAGRRHYRLSLQRIDF